MGHLDHNSMHKKSCYLGALLSSSSFISCWKLSPSIVNDHTHSTSHSCHNEIGSTNYHNIHHTYQVMISIITCLITHNFTSSTKLLFEEPHRVLNVSMPPTIQISHQQVIKVLWGYSLLSKFLILTILPLLDKGSYPVITTQGIYIASTLVFSNCFASFSLVSTFILVTSMLRSCHNILSTTTFT